MSKKARNLRVYLRSRNRLNKVMAECIINMFSKPTKFPIEYLTETEKSKEMKKYDWNLTKYL